MQVGDKPYTRFDVPLFATSISVPPTPYPQYRAYFNGPVGEVAIGRLLGGSGTHNGQIWNRHTKDSIFLVSFVYQP